MQSTGHAHSQRPQATQRSLPFAICTSTGMPRNAGETGCDSSGYCTVKIVGLPRMKPQRLRKKWRVVTARPRRIASGPSAIHRARPRRRADGDDLPAISAPPRVGWPSVRSPRLPSACQVTPRSAAPRASISAKIGARIERARRQLHAEAAAERDEDLAVRRLLTGIERAMDALHPPGVVGERAVLLRERQAGQHDVARARRAGCSFDGDERRAPRARAHSRARVLPEIPHVGAGHEEAADRARAMPSRMRDEAAARRAREAEVACAAAVRRLLRP